eukprot:762676-Hanusia_phi.AAC.2
MLLCPREGLGAIQPARSRVRHSQWFFVFYSPDAGNLLPSLPRRSSAVEQEAPQSECQRMRGSARLSKQVAGQESWIQKAVDRLPLRPSQRRRRMGNSGSAGLLLRSYLIASL